MSIDEFRNELRLLLNSAIKAGLDIDAIIKATDGALHPEFDLDELLDGMTEANIHPET